MLNRISDARVAADEAFDEHPDKLAVKNGVIDLRTGKLLPHSPDYLFRISSKVEYIPGFRCEKFENYLQRVMEGSRDIPSKLRNLQRLAGSTITGYAKDKVFIRLYSQGGDTGKTTLVEGLAKCLGDYSCTQDPRLLLSGNATDNNRVFALADLIGKRMLYMSETADKKSGSQFSAPVIKRLVGNDMLTGRYPGGAFVKFMPRYTAWLSTNGCTRMSAGGDDAFWRRVKTVRFASSMTEAEKDTSFVDDVQNPESDFLKALLVWAVEGSVAWFKHGLGTMSEDIQRDSEEYRSNADVFHEFFSDLNFGEGNYVTAKYLNAFYQKHRVVTDAAKAPSIQAMLGELRKRLGLAPSVQASKVYLPVDIEGAHKERTRTWVGVRVNQDAMDELAAEWAVEHIAPTGTLEEANKNTKEHIAPTGTLEEANKNTNERMVTIMKTTKKQYVYEKTRYPKIFEKTYWGHPYYEPSKEQLPDYIFENRNKFVEDLQIVRYEGLRTVYYDAAVGGSKHVEAYRDKDKNIILLNSLYETPSEAPRVTPTREWQQYAPMYTNRTNTYIVKFKNVADVRLYLKGK